MFNYAPIKKEYFAIVAEEKVVAKRHDSMY